MLNSEFMADQSRRFAERIRREAGESADAQIQHGLKLVLQREPSQGEVAICRRTIDTLKTEHHLSDEIALQRFALLALNLNEFVYLD
jgi:hypothetical protein